MRIDPVIFRQYDIRGTVGQDLTPEVARAVGRAMGSEARERLGRPATLAVGRDNRPSGESLLGALIDGLRSTGAKVLSVGLVPTPVLYFAIHHLAADGGVQVTGSHNPPEMNGFKMVLAGLPFAGDDIQGLRTRIESDRFVQERGAVTTHDVLPAYRQEIIGRREPDDGNDTAGHDPINRFAHTHALFLLRLLLHPLGDQNSYPLPAFTSSFLPSAPSGRL